MISFLASVSIPNKTYILKDSKLTSTNERCHVTFVFWVTLIRMVVFFFFYFYYLSFVISFLTVKNIISHCMKSQHGEEECPKVLPLIKKLLAPDTCWERGN